MLRASALLSLLAGCRIGFDARTRDAAGDGRPTIDAPPLPVAYVKPFAERHPGAGATDSFSAQASAAGDFVALQVACSDPTTPTNVAVTAPGWTFAPLGGVFPSGSLYAGTFIAVAPDNAPAMVTVTWDVGCTGGKSALGDEFAHAALDQVSLSGGAGNGTGTLPIAADNAAIWAACFSSFSVTAVGPGYTKGADNGGGDWTEYKLTSDPAGTNEVAQFTSTTAFIVSMLSLRPQ